MRILYAMCATHGTHGKVRIIVAQTSENVNRSDLDGVLQASISPDRSQKYGWMPYAFSQAKMRDSRIFHVQAVSTPQSFPELGLLHMRCLHLESSIYTTVVRLRSRLSYIHILILGYYTPVIKRWEISSKCRGCAGRPLTSEVSKTRSLDVKSENN